MNVSAIRPSFESFGSEESKPVEKYVSPETKTKREIQFLKKQTAALKRSLRAEERRIALVREAEALADKLEELRHVRR